MLHSVMLVRLRKMGRGVKSNISVLIAIILRTRKDNANVIFINR